MTATYCVHNGVLLVIRLFGREMALTCKSCRRVIRRWRQRTEAT